MSDKSAVVPDPTAIGDVSSPPFVLLPEPLSLFALRATRFRQLAQATELAPYLLFLAELSQAQHDIQTDLPQPDEPEATTVARAREFGMPFIDRSAMDATPVLDTIFDRLFAAAERIDKPAAASEALSRVRAADGGERLKMAKTIFTHTLPADSIAEHIFVWAALQVHLSRLSAVLPQKKLVPVADGVCPACGGTPVASMVVGWPGSHGARFCCCSLCCTFWNYVRIKCALCGSTKGIGYKEIEGREGTVKAETCDECRSWLKIFYQDREPSADPVADDVASLGLDLLMRQGPYHRGGFSPLLAGL